MSASFQRRLQPLLLVLPKCGLTERRFWDATGSIIDTARLWQDRQNHDGRFAGLPLHDLRPSRKRLQL